MSKKPYGSGHFGEWFMDEHGLPAYRYTCNQYQEARATSLVNQVWRSPTEHSHQIGNDRIVAVASNDGWVQVRQDEGAPKFLNEYNPSARQFGGGYGYLVDGDQVLSTIMIPNTAPFERHFGMGYLRKIVTGMGLQADQIVFAPYGDDPLLISMVTITNQRSTPAELRWFEVWDAQPHQFSFRSALRAYAKDNITSAKALRRQLAKCFKPQYRLLDQSGLALSWHFKGYPIQEQLIWLGLQAAFATFAKAATGGPIHSPDQRANMDDLTPPEVFLIALDGLPCDFQTNQDHFFNPGGVEHPAGLFLQMEPFQAENAKGSTLILSRALCLKARDSQTLAFAFGYLPDEMKMDALLEKYRRDPQDIFAVSCQGWKKPGISFTSPGLEWINRELHWDQYYLRSGLTYDDYFGEHILSQGCNYQYIVGIQAAARDPLQHILPWIFSQPHLVKEVIRYTFKTMKPDGSLPWGITGHGMWMPSHLRPSDLQLWLLWAASEYVLATRDESFLNESIDYYPLYASDTQKTTIRKALWQAFLQVRDTIPGGDHHLFRLSNGDWNDSLLFGNLPKPEIERLRRVTESVLNAAMSAYVLNLYGDLLSADGDAERSQNATGLANEQRKALQYAWNGHWFRRANLGGERWIGDEEIWLEPQPWALISEAAQGGQAQTLVQSINDHLRRPSRLGAMINTGIKAYAARPGIAQNGGVWAAINGTLVWGLNQVDPNLAWDEWLRNTLAHHAETFPDIWYGIWSAPDFYNSDLSDSPGEAVLPHHILGHPEETADTKNAHRNKGISWTDFPVMNMHAHAWPLYSLARMIVRRFTPTGLILALTLPLPEFCFSTPLLGVEKQNNAFSGWYAPQQSGHWQVKLILPTGQVTPSWQLQVNGQITPYQIEDDAITFSGQSTEKQPLRWEISLPTIL